MVGVITFRLCGKSFGLPVGTVREVVPIAWLDRPPHMPSMVQGILNLGGQAVPVLLLDKLLGLDGAVYGLDASILIMRDDHEAGRPLGLLVEHVDGVRAVEDFTTMGFADRHSFNGCLSDQLERDGKVVSLLAWQKILLVEERERVADFQALAQARLADLSTAES
ncbi:MAG: chemotaxis protein CheW [Phaeospirillum sp.]|nr:chemotaxis protein CheW [Phaeospirillum sp.]